MAEHNQLYQNAVYYDIALRRDVGPEVDFLGEVFRRHAGGEVRSMLDIACGPGYHARECARRGIMTWGLDLRPEMIEFAADEARKDGVTAGWLVGDMRDFRLDAPVELALSVFDALDALTDDADVVRHFQAVAANLSPGGLYVLDNTHPRDTSLTDYGSYAYSGARDGVSVEITWATNHPVFDLETSVAYVETEMRVDDRGQKSVVKDGANEKLVTPLGLKLSAELSGALRVVGWYGNFELDQPFDFSPGAQRMITVMQKVG